MQKNSILFTVDVEDWYHAAVMQRTISSQKAYTALPRLVENLTTLGQWLTDNDAKATFFCLSSLGPAVNNVLRRLSDEGHEIASHGHSHSSLNLLSHQDLLNELKYSRVFLEDLIGKSVVGFRAPNFSITDQSIDMLLEAGYVYDSSVYNVPWHPNYGRLESLPIKSIPYQLPNGLVEFPLSVWRKGPFPIPLAGGAYLRHFPFALFKLGAAQLAAQGYFNFYVHPWEVDLKHPVPPGLNWIDKIRHFRNLKQVLPRIQSLRESFLFKSIKEQLASEKCIN